MAMRRSKFRVMVVKVNPIWVSPRSLAHSVCVYFCFGDDWDLGKAKNDEFKICKWGFGVD